MWWESENTDLSLFLEDIYHIYIHDIHISKIILILFWFLVVQTFGPHPDKDLERESGAGFIEAPKLLVKNLEFCIWNSDFFLFEFFSSYCTVL